MIIPVARCARFALLQIYIALSAALNTASRVEDASLGPALVDEVILALVATKDAAI